MKLRALLLSAFFFSGFAALVYEVMFTKGLILFVGGTVFAYSLILTAFLTGMGFGSLLAKRFQETDLATLFAYVQLGIGAYGLLFVPILNNLDVAYLEIYNISHGSFVAFHSSSGAHSKGGSSISVELVSKSVPLVQPASLSMGSVLGRPDDHGS